MQIRDDVIMRPKFQIVHDIPKICAGQLYSRICCDTSTQNVNVRIGLNWDKQ